MQLFPFERVTFLVVIRGLRLSSSVALEPSLFNQHVGSFYEQVETVKPLLVFHGLQLSCKANAGKWEVGKYSLGSTQEKEEAGLVRKPIFLKILLHVTSNIFPETSKSFH